MRFSCRISMEPFELKVQQVNFDAEDLSLSSSTELDSFSTVINFDSQFSSANTGTSLQPTISTAALTYATTNKKRDATNNMSTTSSEDTAKEQTADNNNAFETVADALHLQWSVIGDKKLAPAPPEVVAQVVAEAERRLKSQNRGDATVSPLPTHSPKKTSDINPLLPHSPVKSQEPTRNAISVTKGAIYTDTANSHIDSPLVHSSSHDQKSSSPVSKELIRVPPGSIVRTTEKSSWFSSKPESDRRLLINSNSDLMENVVNEKATEQSNCDTQSVSSSTSELETFEQSETDKFLKTLPPFKMIDLSDIVPKKRVERTYSPPVKETSFKPVQNNANSIVNLPSNDAWNSGISHNPQLMDSGIDLEVENDKVGTVFNSNIVTNNRPSYVIPQPGPLFQKSLRHSTPKAKDVTSMQKVESNVSNEKLEEILREKAKLEGQLEMLSQEAQVTLQERAELQAQVASLKLKLKSPKGHGNNQEKETLKVNLEKMQRARSLLEQSMASAHKILDEKSSELKMMQEELNMSQDSADKLQLQLKELKDEMRAKEMTVQALKNKIAELYVEVQNVMQQKMESDTEARSARNELNSLVNAKNWYQHQLKIAQEARSKLQHELTVVQAQAAAQGGVVERLKTQNTQLQQQLKETQHKAIREKEMLAKHLETIQIDMLDREAAFQEIQRERTFLEDTFNNKLQFEENEKSRIEILMQMSSDLENQLEKAHSDLKKKQTQIITLENDQIELTKKLALSQENIVERDNTIGELQEKLLEVEVHLKAFQTGLETKESEIWKLKEEKAATEISLKSALEEKASVDKALENLKADMGKVERSFRHMKQELTGKATELENLRSEKLKAQEKLEELTIQMEKERRNIELSQQDSGGKENLIQELQSQKRLLEQEVMLLKDDIVRLEDSYGESVREKENLSLEFVNMQQKLAATEQELIQSNTAVETYQKKEVDLSEMESSNEETSAERDRLETELDMAHRKYDLSVIEQQDQMKTELQ
ncbi:hypothetical protein KUTeg_009808 [Tegillarca granosa]|uniref:Uncharacterized protein n=1 Tax=Tegillarca granosa TaxID=220873 RepID=A0ABQ9FA14_TEGGR|nr:hypothetical protein KUTeg_009808 [Tegillarca granosa]